MCKSGFLREIVLIISLFILFVGKIIEFFILISNFWLCLIKLLL